MLREFAAEDERIEPTYAVLEEGEPKDVRRHRFQDFVEGRICQDCNNGWMSDLETEARPLLLELSSRRGALPRLGAEETKLLARWAAKTAYMLNSASNFPFATPNEHFRTLHEGQLEDGVHVFGGYHLAKPHLSWVQGPIWRTERQLGRQRFDELAPHSYKVTLVIGHLMLLVAYWPDPTWHYLMTTNVHRRIWPDRGSQLYFDQVFFREDEQASKLGFHWLLGVIKQRVLREPLGYRGAVEGPPSCSSRGGRGRHTLPRGGAAGSTRASSDVRPGRPPL